MGWKRRERERERKRGEAGEQTLMPPCRPQMLQQLQTSSFLHSPSFLPFLATSQIEKERQGDICRIQTYHIPFATLCLPFSYSASSFRSHLSCLSCPLPPPLRTMTSSYTCGGKEGGHGRHGDGGLSQRDTNFRLNLTRQGGKRTLARYTLLF